MAAEFATFTMSTSGMESYSKPERFSWRDGVFVVIIPNGANTRYFPRAPPHQLRELLYQEHTVMTATNPETSQHAFPDRQSDDFYLAQLVHYGLEFNFVAGHAHRALEVAVEMDLLDVPPHLRELRAQLRKAYDDYEAAKEMSLPRKLDLVPAATSSETEVVPAHQIEEGPDAGGAHTSDEDEPEKESDGSVSNSPARRAVVSGREKTNSDTLSSYDESADESERQNKKPRRQHEQENRRSGTVDFFGMEAYAPTTHRTDREMADEDGALRRSAVQDDFDPEPWSPTSPCAPESPASPPHSATSPPYTGPMPLNPPRTRHTPASPAYADSPNSPSFSPTSPAPISPASATGHIYHQHPRVWSPPPIRSNADRLGYSARPTFHAYVMNDEHREYSAHAMADYPAPLGLPFDDDRKSRNSSAFFGVPMVSPLCNPAAMGPAPPTLRPSLLPQETMDPHSYLFNTRSPSIKREQSENRGEKKRKRHHHGKCGLILPGW